jgi:transcriptional regulator with XRE-family HTH domain
MLDPVQIGERIRAARLSRGMTQAEVAAAIGRTKPSVCNYEAGRVVPHVGTLVALCGALRRSLDWLLLGLSRSAWRVKK